MQPKIRFGILSTAKIAIAKVIPAMQKCDHCEVVAHSCSRDLSRAKETATKLNIPKSYGAYEELLADPDIDAIYNPLPNHMHVQWSIRAAEAGKHVLCEKPLGLNPKEAEALIAARDIANVKIAEAFMIHVHPQWLRTRQIIQSCEIGELRTMHCIFSFFNRDPANIRNRPEYGGGALMDIGCYPIHASRWIFGTEPRRVGARIERDTEFGIDHTISGMLDFPNGQALFTTSMQMNPYPSACNSSSQRQHRNRNPVQRIHPTARPEFSSAPAQPTEIRNLPRLRPVHASGRRLRPRHSR